jgi:hypothetical protein
VNCEKYIGLDETVIMAGSGKVVQSLSGPEEPKLHGRAAHLAVPLSDHALSSCVSAIGTL